VPLKEFLFELLPLLYNGLVFGPNQKIALNLYGNSFEILYLRIGNIFYGRIYTYSIKIFNVAKISQKYFTYLFILNLLYNF
jgi:hypothetical protein